MANKKILLYLKEGLKRGHSISSLQKALVKQGVNASEVNQAIKELKIPTSPKNKVSAKTILTIVVLVALVVGAFCFKDKINPNTGETESIPIPTIEDCKKSEMDIFDSCIASVKNDLRICKNMLKKDYSPYTLSSPEKAMADCIDSFYFVKIIKEKNSAICNEIQNKYQKEFCLAFVNKDVTKCSNVKDPITKFYEEEDEIACKAIINNDIKECDSLKEKEAREDCLDMFYEAKAIENSDPSYCEKRTTIESKNSCLAVVTKKTSYCNLVRDDMCVRIYIQ